MLEVRDGFVCLMIMAELVMGLTGVADVLSYDCTYLYLYIFSCSF